MFVRIWTAACGGAHISIWSTGSGVFRRSARACTAAACAGRRLDIARRRHAVRLEALGENEAQAQALPVMCLGAAAAIAAACADHIAFRLTGM